MSTHFSQEIIFDIINNYYTIDCLIETGTYKGDTIDMFLMQDPVCDTIKIFSTEIDNELYNLATTKYDDCNNVMVFNMHSPAFITAVQNSDEFKRIQNPVYWLDAHASGPLKGIEGLPCPLLEEIKSIFNTSPKDYFIILIDDIRLFGSPEWNGINMNQVVSLVSDFCTKLGYELTIKFYDGEQPLDIMSLILRKRVDK